jgi:hypothetical protein
MKNLLYILIVIACVSCKKDSNIKNSEFDPSLQKWNVYKASVNNSYIYSTTTNSFSRISTTTTIAVESGIITLRSYVAYTTSGGTSIILKTWTENNSTLNTHSEGAPGITIDDIYSKAKNEWLTVDKKQNQIIFQTDGNGIIAQCGYIPNNCADDCFVGVNIKSIEHL